MHVSVGKFLSIALNALGLTLAFSAEVAAGTNDCGQIYPYSGFPFIDVPDVYDRCLRQAGVGDASAQMQVSTIIRIMTCDSPTKKDVSAELAWLELAANAGYPEAMYEKALSIDNGLVEGDSNTLLISAARAGYPSAQYKVAMDVLNRQSASTEEKREAIRLLLDAATGGSDEAAVALAFAAIYAPRGERGEHDWPNFYSVLSAESQRIVHRALSEQRVIEGDGRKEALGWFSSAATHSMNERAINALIKGFHDGWFGEKDSPRSFAWRAIDIYGVPEDSEEFQDFKRTKSLLGAEDIRVACAFAKEISHASNYLLPSDKTYPSPSNDRFFDECLPPESKPKTRSCLPNKKVIHPIKADRAVTR